MTLDTAIVIALGLFLGPVVANWLVARRPKDRIVTVQKTTNSASQPEIITAQGFVPADADEDVIWNEMEALALAATSRMVSVNEMILDHTEAMSAKIAAERPVLKDKFLKKLEKRRKKWASKKLGIPIDEVTDERIAHLVAQTQGPADKSGDAEA